MSIDRMRRVLTPCIALLALAVALVIVGMAVAGSAAAASDDDASPGGVTIQSRDAILEFGDPVRVALDERVGSVVSFGGDVTVAGTVTHTIVSFGGDVLLLPTARVGGALSETDASVVSFGGTITAREGAQVTGGLERVEEGDWARALDVPVPHLGDVGSWVGFSFLGWLVQTALFLVLGLVAAALLPKQMLAVGRALSVRPGASIGWGALAFFFVVPAVALVLLISIIGILLLIPAIVVVPLIYFFVTVSVAASIAQRLMSGSGRRQNLMLATVLGVVGMTIVSRIPVAGVLALLVMTLFGTGAAILAMLEWRRGRRMTSAPTPAGGPVGDISREGSPSAAAPPAPPPLGDAPISGQAAVTAVMPVAAATGPDGGTAITEVEASVEPEPATVSEEAPTAPGDVEAVTSSGAAAESESPGGIEEATAGSRSEEPDLGSSAPEASGEKPPEGR